MTKTKKILFYVLTALVSLVFIMGAYPKLVADPMSVEGFAKAHLPLWFMYFIGVAEVAGAIGLWIPKLSKWAAYGLTIIMVGAIVVTVIFTGVVQAIVPVVIIAILWYINKLSAEKKAMMPMTTPSPTTPGNPTV